MGIDRAPGRRAARRPAATRAGSATSRRRGARRGGRPGRCCARSIVRSTSSMVCWTLGRIIASNSARVIRTVDGVVRAASPGCRSPRPTTAPPWRRRTAGAAGRSRPQPSGCWRAASRTSRGTLSTANWNTASSKSMPPRRSMPAGSIDVLERRALTAQQGDVERAATEVVDEHRRRRARRGDGGVVDRRRRRLGDQLGVAEPDVDEGVAQRAELVLGPVRRMRDHDAVGGAADLLGHRVDRPTGPSARSAGRRGTASPTASAGPGSPTRRLNSRASPSGCAAPRRSAAPPNSSSSPAAKITDGTAT